MRCCVSTCPNSKRLVTDISLFSIPKGESRIHWINSLKLDPESIKNKTRVCIRHFTEDDVFKFPTRTKLKPKRIPTIDIPNPVVVNRYTIEDNITLVDTEHHIENSEQMELVKLEAKYDYNEYLTDNIENKSEIKLKCELKQEQSVATATDTLVVNKFEIKTETLDDWSVDTVSDFKIKTENCFIKSEELDIKPEINEEHSVAATNLDVLENVQTGEELYSFVCQQSATQAVHLENVKSKSHTCSVCEKSFTKHWWLVNHMQTHKEKKLISCDICGKSFKEQFALKIHNRIHTGEKPFKCEACDKSFTQTAHLTEHMRLHTGEKPFSCKFCDKSFTRRTHLTLHARMHTGEKPFSCTICQKSFTRGEHLKLHMTTHTGDKPFKCEICSKSFARRYDLTTIHMRTHRGEKPFKCEYCNKCFTLNYNLKTHIRTHTGEKPYSCSVCNKSFTENKQRKDHMRKHTGEKPFKCEVCDKYFSLKHNLRKHSKTHTGTASEVKRE